ncbi:hypothetical protein [Anaerosinus sp.]
MNRSSRRKLSKKGVAEKVIGLALTDTQRKIRIDTINDLSAMVYMVLHDKFGFGEKRIKRFYSEMGKLGECMRDGLVNMDDMKKMLLEECKINIGGVSDDK